MADGSPAVVAVSASATHSFSKSVVPSIDLITGIGVAGDAHSGATVRHRSRVRRDPTQPNLRQVHLMHAELFDDLRVAGFDVAPGDLGENVTTCGVDLLGLPEGAVLTLGDDAVVEITGLRNPCYQIDDFRSGLLKQVVGVDTDGNVVRRTGVMAVVRVGGTVRTGDPITVAHPGGPHRPLEKV